MSSLPPGPDEDAFAKAVAADREHRDRSYDWAADLPDAPEIDPAITTATFVTTPSSSQKPSDSR